MNDGSLCFTTNKRHPGNLKMYQPVHFSLRIPKHTIEVCTFNVWMLLLQLSPIVFINMTFPRIYTNLEQVLINAHNKEDYYQEFEGVMQFFHNDFDKSVLKTQLELFSLCRPVGSPLQPVRPNGCGQKGVWWAWPKLILRGKNTYCTNETISILDRSQ